MSNASESRDWTREVFGHSELGDSRLTRRLVQIAGDGAARPGGRVLQVCPSSATRQGAYDFLSNPRVAPEKIQAALTQATTRLCEEEKFCFVSIDGTALTLTDWSQTKDFGAVGATNLGARGLKVLNAYAISAHGTPLGVLGQQWWTREARKKRKETVLLLCERCTGLGTGLRCAPPMGTDFSWVDSAASACATPLRRPRSEANTRSESREDLTDPNGSQRCWCEP